MAPMLALQIAQPGLDASHHARASNHAGAKRPPLELWTTSSGQDVISRLKSLPFAPMAGIALGSPAAHFVGSVAMSPAGAGDLGVVVEPYPNRTYWYVWGALSTVSGAISAYHGYKRNQSVGWAIVWYLLGSIFPVITPVVAFAQGYGKPGPGARAGRAVAGFGDWEDDPSVADVE